MQSGERGGHLGQVGGPRVRREVVANAKARSPLSDLDPSHPSIRRGSVRARQWDVTRGGGGVGFVVLEHIELPVFGLLVAVSALEG